jgi:hypothetical protein
MRFKWTRVTESEFKRLVERCNFTPIELQIFEMRRKSCKIVEIAFKTDYSDRQIIRISHEIVAKINHES